MDTNICCMDCARAARTLDGRTIRHDPATGTWVKWQRRQHRWEPVAIDAEQTAQIAAQFLKANGPNFAPVSERAQMAAFRLSQKDPQFQGAARIVAGMLHVHEVGQPKPRRQPPHRNPALSSWGMSW